MNNGLRVRLAYVWLTFVGFFGLRTSPPLKGDVNQKRVNQKTRLEIFAGFVLSKRCKNDTKGIAG